METKARNVSAESDILKGEEGSTEQIQAAFDSLEEFEICAEIARSGYFDESYYLANSPDVAITDLDPLTHYIRYGGGGRAESRANHWILQNCARDLRAANACSCSISGACNGEGARDSQS